MAYSNYGQISCSSYSYNLVQAQSDCWTKRKIRLISIAPREESMDLKLHALKKRYRNGCQLHIWLLVYTKCIKDTRHVLVLAACIQAETSYQSAHLQAESPEKGQLKPQHVIESCQRCPRRDTVCS